LSANRKSASCRIIKRSTNHKKLSPQTFEFAICGTFLGPPTFGIL
jgi:hypothetical protein